MMLDNKGEEDESIRLDEMNLEIQIECLGKDHPNTATPMHNVGISYANKGENEKALEKFQSALLIAEKVYGNNHPHTEEIRDNAEEIKYPFGRY